MASLCQEQENPSICTLAQGLLLLLLQLKGSHVGALNVGEEIHRRPFLLIVATTSEKKKMMNNNNDRGFLPGLRRVVV